MAFTVPNEATASYTDQSELDAVDISILAAGFNGTGVISGCAVTAQSTPDDTVAVSAGSIRVSGTTVSVTGANVNVLSGSANADGTTTTAADANYFRYDLIVCNSSGQLGVIHGTVPAPAWPDYSVNPVFPAVSGVCLAAILVPPTAASITGIATSQIVRKDLVLNINGQHDAAHSIVGSNHSAGWGGKGYLPVGTAAGTAAALTVGTNGQILTAQSGQTTGLQWANLFTPPVFSKAGTLTTGTGTFRWYNDTGRTLTFSKVRASEGTAPTGTTSTPITGASGVFDVNKDGTSIWASTQANRVNIQASANTGTQTSFDTTTIADGSYLTVDIDFVGSTVAGADLTVQIWMTG